MMKLHPVAAAALLAICLAPVQAAPAAGTTAAREATPPASTPADNTSLPYTVQPRDTMIGLGRNLLNDPASWREVARLNRLRDPNTVHVGQTLQVPLRLLRSTELPVSVLSTEGEVAIAGAPVAPGARLAKGQSLNTGAAGSAVVQLGDGSRVKVAPGTELSLAEHRRFVLRAGAPVPDDGAPESLFASTMRLVRGSVELLASKVLRAKPLEVQTPTAVIGVRGTEYRVHHDPEATNPTRTEVLDGRVRADVATTTGSARLGDDVPAGYGAALQPARAPALAKLSPAPDLAALPARFERPLIRLPLAAEPQALRVQVAADAGFERLVRDERFAAGQEIRIAGLEDGRWHLRLRRIDAAGIEGYDASREIVLKARPEPPPTTLPQSRQKLPVGDVQIAWAKNTEAASYGLEIARDAGFAEVVQKVDGIVGAATQLTMNEPGRYHWRMASVRADGDRGPWGDPQQFELRPLPEAPKGGLSEDAKALELSWGGRPEDRHQVELARDAAFTDVLARSELSESRWSLPTPSAGSYYFRYRSVEPDGFVTPWSQTLTLEVPRDWRFLLLGLPFLLAL